MNPLRYHQVLKYVISGGAATATNLAVLYCLGEFFALYYLTASVLAFIVSIAVSFILQKFWVFEDATTHRVHVQFALYLGVVLGNLALNTALVFLLVEKAHLWYLFAQFLSGLVVAVTGFFAYRHFVFTNHPDV